MTSAGSGSSRACNAYAHGATLALGLSTVSEAPFCEVPAASGLAGLLPLWAAGADLSVYGGAVETFLYEQSHNWWSVAPQQPPVNNLHSSL